MNSKRTINLSKFSCSEADGFKGLKWINMRIMKQLNFYQERYDNTRMMFLGNLNIEVNKNSIKQGVELN